MGARGRIRVLVVDDQPLIRHALAELLGTAEEIEVIGQAADGEEAVSAARGLRPDVVLMDLQMPRVDGVAATRRIAGELPGTRVVVLTAYAADDLVFEAFRAGAVAYLLKGAPEPEVLDTVRAAQRGESRLAPPIARMVIEQLRRLPSGAPARKGAPPAPETLTAREERILTLIAEGRSNREIARIVLLAEGTVKNHVSRIMAKLHARTRTELAVKAVRGR